MSSAETSVQRPSRLTAGMIAPLVLVTSLFFLWGVANNLNDILIKQFKKAFVLSDFESSLVQSAFYLGYFLFAIPAALFMRRFGYKAAIVTGLMLFGAGALAFYPAAEIRTYGAFLFALFVIASGLAFLETSANPFMALLGDPASATRRLNFAQAFNPLGSIAGVLIGRRFILSGFEPTQAQLAAMPPAAVTHFYATEARAVQGPYLLLGGVVLLWALLILMVKFPPIVEPEAADATPGKKAGFLGLLRRPRLLFGVLAQFFYVGAQVGLWSFTIRYAQHAVPGMGEKVAADYLTYSLIAFIAGRFVGAALMGRISPQRLAGLYALINIGLCAVAAFVGGEAGLIALVAASFFMSILFPTIFATAIQGLGPLTKPGSSLLVMSIIGGAVLSAAMGRVSDLSSIEYAMLVPAAAFAVVAMFAFGARDRGVAAAA
jgi:FHS family L-fucose permease-like MFS transporter